MEDLWAHWKLAYGKSYTSEEHESLKFVTFCQNYLFILNWNQEEG